MSAPGHRHACWVCQKLDPVTCYCPTPAVVRTCAERPPGERSPECLTLGSGKHTGAYAELRIMFKLDMSSHDEWVRRRKAEQSGLSLEIIL